MFGLEVMFIEVAGYVLDRYGLGPEHVIATFWGMKEPLSPEALKKAQAFLQDECGAVMTGTVSRPDRRAGPVPGEGVPANGSLTSRRLSGTILGEGLPGVRN